MSTVLAKVRVGTQKCRIFIHFSLHYSSHFIAPCNVPTLGHQGITGCYDDQSSKMEIIAST
jgi:hypothetical protein